MDIIRHGDKNQHVHMLQKALNQQGATLFVDGDFGSATEAAVIEYQKRVNLIADGIVGRQTQAALMGQTDPKALTHKAALSASTQLDIPMASLLAITEVEAGGDGFLPNGKPDILFERHIMYRALTVNDTPVDDLVRTQPNLVNPRPGGYAGGATEHYRLNQARKIDDQSALCATSWGMFQIMGFHYQRLAYNSVQDFAADMGTHENAQLLAFARFIESDKALHKALQAKKWSQFSRIYNGPNYKRNLYDSRLARAYQRHAEKTEVST